jgi:hypothetical protein
MRRNNSLVLLLAALMFCSLFLLPAGIQPAQASGGNLADEAVAFIKDEYRDVGGQGAFAVRLPFALYVLETAGVDTSTSDWIYNGVAIRTAVANMVDQDINDPAVSVKSLAQDLITMQSLGDINRVNQLQARLADRQSSDGSFAGEDSVYGAFSILPAYELLGRADKLSIIDAVYARTYILNQQDDTSTPPGAWATVWNDFMSTAEAVRALSYLDPAGDDQALQDAISGGLTWMRQQQQADGSFQAGMDSSLVDAVEAIATQLALNIDPASAGGWKHASSGKSAVDFLNGYDVTTGNVMDAVWLLDACNLLGIRPTGSSDDDSSGPGGGTASGTSVGVAVVGRSSQKLLSPTFVTVNPGNRWGLTALGALDAAVGGSSYTTNSGTFGCWVTGIYGLANETYPSTAGWMYTLNDIAPTQGADATTVRSGDHVIWYYSESMDQVPPTWAQLIASDPGGGTTGANSTTGSATVTPSAGGAVSLGSRVSLNIPANALQGTAGVNVTIQEVGNPPDPPEGYAIIGAYSFTVGGQESYDFNAPVTLTFTFDPASVPPGQTPAVYYHNGTGWVLLTGTVSGNTITVTVDHFTTFAVLAGEEVPAPVPVQNFSDVAASYWASDVITSLAGQGYIAGYPDGTFKPDNTITRAEFVTILDKVMKLADNNPATPGFSDVSSQDWFYGSVENAVYAGLVKGYGQTFGPNSQINREELATILVRALNEQDQAAASMSVQTGFTDDGGISGWARGYVAAAVEKGLLKGYPDNSFRAKNSATRAETCAMIANFLNVRK